MMVGASVRMAQRAHFAVRAHAQICARGCPVTTSVCPRMRVMVPLPSVPRLPVIMELAECRSDSTRNPRKRLIMGVQPLHAPPS